MSKRTKRMIHSSMRQTKRTIHGLRRVMSNITAYSNHKPKFENLNFFQENVPSCKCDRRKCCRNIGIVETSDHHQDRIHKQYYNDAVSINLKEEISVLVKYLNYSWISSKIESFTLISRKENTKISRWLNLQKLKKTSPLKLLHISTLYFNLKGESIFLLQHFYK